MKLNPAKQKLLKELKSLVAEERQLTTKILHLLREVEKSKLYAELGFSSLFDFTVRELGYSNDAAFRRISAMRLIKALPEVEEKLESGKLSLTSAAELQKYFRAEDKSQKQSHHTAAGGQDATLGAQKSNAPKTKLEKIELLESLIGKSTREVSRVLFQAASAPAQKLLLGSKEKPISEDLTQLTITVDKVTHQKIQKLMALLSNKNKTGDFTGLLEILVDESLKRHDPEATERGGIGRHNADGDRSHKNHTRYIPAPIKRQVYLRDQGRCQYPGCNANRYLQYDHIKPFTLGGQSTFQNLQLLCSAHNRFKGAKSMARNEASQ